MSPQPDEQQPLKEFVEWFREDLLYKAPEVWPGHVKWFLDELIARYGTADRQPGNPVYPDQDPGNRQCSACGWSWTGDADQCPNCGYAWKRRYTTSPTPGGNR